MRSTPAPGGDRALHARPPRRARRAARPSRPPGRGAGEGGALSPAGRSSRRPRGRRSPTPGAGSSRRSVFSRRLPESRSTLEQAFDIRLELRPVLTQLGEVRQTLERLREAEALAERLNDDRRRGRVAALDDERAHGARRAGRGARVWHPRAGDRPTPRGLETSHSRHDLPRAGALLSGRVRTGGRTGNRQPRGVAAPTGCTNISEPLRHHRSTIAAGWS